MEARPRTLRYFELTEGHYPFRDWLLGLKDSKARDRLDWRLLKLELGNLGHWRSVGQGVLELKEDFGPGYRVYIAEDGPVVVLLLAGGTKASQSKDIKLARAYWVSYQAKKGSKDHA